MLFLRHLATKMRSVKDGAGRAGIVLNGSPLLTARSRASSPAKEAPPIGGDHASNLATNQPPVCYFHTTREDYVARICAGGFPLALARSASQRSRWFADYVRQCLERDVLEPTRLQQRPALADLLGRVAGQTAQVLNVTAASEGMAIAPRTAEDYVRLLEDLFLVSRLPAWGKTLRSRARARPKVHVVDSGVAAHLMGLSQQRLAKWDPTVQTEFGHLVETFVVGELRKQVSWLDEPVTVGHWRTGDGAGVDAVVEFYDGSVIAFEIKASRSANPKDFRGLSIHAQCMP